MVASRLSLYLHSGGRCSAIAKPVLWLRRVRSHGAAEPLKRDEKGSPREVNDVETIVPPRVVDLDKNTVCTISKSHFQSKLGDPRYTPKLIPSSLRIL